jgi:hypothetical protein
MGEAKEYKDFEVVVNKDYTLTLKLSIWQQEHLAGVLAAVWTAEQQCGKWLQEGDAPEAEKEKYKPMMLNMLHARSLLVHLFTLAGITDEELKTLLNMPF